MKLVVLGSGTSVPHPARAASAFWLETKPGSLLLDISPDTAHRMAQEGLAWAHLDAIWVSHFHLDHVGGLAPFLFGLKWAPQTQDRTRPLNIFGPRGLGGLLAAFDQAYDYRLLEQAFAIEIREVAPGQSIELLPGVTAETFSTPHTEESLAIRLTDADGKSLVYTSDTGPSAELGQFAREVDLLLVECSFRKHKKSEHHLELAEAMALAQLARPRQVMLTHLYPEWDDFDIVSEARALWAGEVIAASDGKRIEL